jgi:hypothetical protein
LRLELEQHLIEINLISTFPLFPNHTSMAPKFGASKFRNAVPTVPARDAWYRSNLTSNAPNNTAVYSSVVKANTEHVVTLTPAGDVSVRAYDAVGEKEKDAWSGKFGGVLDWDLSRLEDRGMYVAGADATVSFDTESGYR